MTWELALISTYFLVCDYRSELSAHNMRFTNNLPPAFTDEEVITIYLYCSVNGLKLHTKKEIYTYADRHLRSWFPKLPKYEAFNARVNNLSSCFSALTDILVRNSCLLKPEYHADILEFLLDSLPIMLAKKQRAKTAKVAVGFANFGICATKDMPYHGFKLHVAGLMAANKGLPSLYCSAITPASEHDNKAFKDYIAPNLRNAKVYGDSAFVDEAGAQELLEKYNVTVCPIQKRKKGQQALFYDQKFQNTAISNIRQPIEGYFNWLIEHTDIQDASKCRSIKGVLLQICGKIAAVIVMITILNS
jgi:hypothetical protein